MSIVRYQKMFTVTVHCRYHQLYNLWSHTSYLQLMLL